MTAPRHTADETGVVVRPLERADQFRAANALLESIWTGPAAILPVELLTAFAHAGGYVVGAFVDDTMVGTSVGFLGRHEGRPALHSHVTGVAPTARDAGVGRTLKLHQRSWAQAHDLECITWTFDPLVRRNAWFNLVVLGARVEAYLPSFYGVMDDAINAGDESDRLLAVWDVGSAVAGEAIQGPDPAGTVTIDLIPTPDDIVALRRDDPAAAARWRSTVRTAFVRAMADGGVVTGFTRDGEYVMGSR
jgi:predicted GNAT superfamily acetyltransferase